MNMSSEARLHEDKLNSRRTTTLYDLIEEINMKQADPQWKQADNVRTSHVGNTQFSPVAVKVAEMFESGQIKFKNIQEIRQKYADWFV